MMTSSALPPPAELEQQELARLDGFHQAVTTRVQAFKALAQQREVIPDGFRAFVERMKEWEAVLETVAPSAQYLSSAGRPALSVRLNELLRYFRQERDAIDTQGVFLEMGQQLVEHRELREQIARDVQKMWIETLHGQADKIKQVNDIMNRDWFRSFWPLCPHCEARLENALVTVCANCGEPIVWKPIDRSPSDAWRPKLTE
jgi:hypothetical protein